MSDTTTISDQDLGLNPAESTNDTSTVESKSENELPKHLRSVIEKKDKELKKALLELEAIKQAEADKAKTLEEKLAEKDLALKAKEEEIQKTLVKTSLEKQLLQSNVNSEFLDLMLEKGIKLDSENVIDELKTLYPSAFKNNSEAAKPLGKVGTSITTGNSSIMTKDQVEAMLIDPKQKLTPELLKLAKEYNL